jgi:hypothetical protein
LTKNNNKSAKRFGSNIIRFGLINRLQKHKEVKYKSKRNKNLSGNNKKQIVHFKPYLRIQEWDKKLTNNN